MSTYAPFIPSFAALNFKPKSKAVLYSLISICPGKRHAWYESSVGRIRKPLQGTLQVAPSELKRAGCDHILYDAPPRRPWYFRAWRWVLSFFA